MKIPLPGMRSRSRFCAALPTRSVCRCDHSHRYSVSPKYSPSRSPPAGGLARFELPSRNPVDPWKFQIWETALQLSRFRQAHLDHSNRRQENGLQPHCGCSLYVTVIPRPPSFFLPLVENDQEPCYFELHNPSLPRCGLNTHDGRAALRSALAFPSPHRRNRIGAHLWTE